MKDFSLLPEVIIRSPLLPLETVTGKDGLTVEGIRKYFNDPVIREAIYVASPGLYSECVKWLNDQLDDRDSRRIELTLLKYFSRMCSRCTPFGLFAGVGMAQWAKRTHMRVDAARKAHKHTRLDMYYLCALARKIAGEPEIRKLLRYFPNNSIYEFGDELRYIEFKYVRANREYEISAVENSDYISKVLACAGPGASIRDLQDVLISEGHPEEESEDFIAAMIDNQLLIDDFEPTITGSEFLDQILLKLKNLRGTSGGEILDFYFNRLTEIDEGLRSINQKPGSAPSDYEKIAALLEGFSVPIEKNQLFQVDLSIDFLEAGIDNKLAGQIRKAITLLSNLSRPREVSLTRFKDAFLTRYETAEIPLLQALDNESGIGYLQNQENDPAPIVDDVRVPVKEIDRSFSSNKLQRIFMAKFLEATSTGAYEVSINDLGTWEDENPAELPDTLAATGSFLTGADGKKIFLKFSATGSSAGVLLGRFTHSHGGLGSFCHSLTEHEAKLNPGMILAEIIHIPQSRLGNILARKALRKFEIPVLSRSSSLPENQITLDDLMISVKSQRIILRSKKFDKEVIPRMATAHNFTFNSLPVYHFLCDLQTQNMKTALQINWDMFGIHSTFRPRITMGDVILHRASWTFMEEELKAITGKTAIARDEIIGPWRNKWKIPRYIQLVEGDNELLIDLEHPRFQELFIAEIRGKKQVTLTEFLFENGTTIQDEAGDSYANEFIATFARKQKTDTSGTGTDRPMDLKRKFGPGSEWIYYKIYVGRKTTDAILADQVGSLVSTLIEKGLIDQWFFIRFIDPDPHIRLRMKMTSNRHIGAVMTLFHHVVGALAERGIVNKITIETYFREIERYGEKMEEIEKIFFFQSQQSIHFLQYAGDSDQHELLKTLFMIKSHDLLLDYWGMTLWDKHAFYSRAAKGFSDEFRADKLTNRQLALKFKSLQKMIAGVHGEKTELPESWPVLENYLESFDPKYRECAASVSAHFRLAGKEDYEVLWSLSHMLINRIARAKARKHEFVLYELLGRFFDSKVSRPEKTNEDPAPHAALKN